MAFLGAIWQDVLTLEVHIFFDPRVSPLGICFIEIKRPLLKIYQQACLLRQYCLVTTTTKNSGVGE